jgi:hypothetical protein
MSARNYMPYIEGAMEHINSIYEWNKRVDEMRAEVLGITSIEDYYAFMTNDCQYRLNNGLRMYYEERDEYATARLTDKPLDAVDAIIDQFVVAIGEIRKCALSDTYEYIEKWEDKATKAYEMLHQEIVWNIQGDFTSRIRMMNDTYIDLVVNQALTEVIDALFTRF